MTSDDQELLHRIAGADREAFASFYDLYAPRVFGLILKILQNSDDAEDVLQETFLQIWSTAGRFDPARARVEAWVIMQARSRAIDRLRRRRPQSPEHPPELATEADPFLALSRDETADSLRSALDRLPEEQREPIRMAFFHGQTHEQIAVRLGIPLGTVKTRIRAGMLRLRDQVAGVRP